MTLRNLMAAGLYLLPALLFTVIAAQLSVYRRFRQPHTRMFRLLPVVTSMLAVHYFLQVAQALVPTAMSGTPWQASKVTWFLVLALVSHLLRLLPLPEVPPTKRWLVLNYGLALGAMVVVLTTARQPIAQRAFALCDLLFAVVCLAQFARHARPGPWGPEAAGEMRRPDVVLVATGITAAVLALLCLWGVGIEDLGVVVFEVLIGLTIAAPMAARMLGHVVPEFVVVMTLFFATGGIFAAYRTALLQVGTPYQALLGMAVVLATLGLLTGGQALLRAVVLRGLLRQTNHRVQELQLFMQTLSPEFGGMECCRRALAELTRLHHVPGAAIIFADGETLVHGRFDVEPLRRLWPRGREAEALPAGSYGSEELRELPRVLREALIASNVGLGAAAVRTRHRHWGHLFMQTGYLGGTFREEDGEAFTGFVDQFALLLDAADLLTRTIAVERSLAHAEKLAAIGELAARFAHEIRNPVTAARSLAQQLARDPTSPLNAEHASLILSELERVERQVRDLLLFSRREHLELEDVDLGALVCATSQAMQERQPAADVALELDTPKGIVARIDRDKVRRVLVNLMENAFDSLAAGTSDRRLAIGVAQVDGVATMRVFDNGPGIPVDVQPRIFDPFVSRKSTGTGLGLAIARRTIDAHGGTLTVESHPGATTFEIRLPLVGRP